MINELTTVLQQANKLAQESVEEIVKERDALAVENAALKLKGRELLGEACSVYEKLNATVDHEVGSFADGQTLQEFDFLLSVGVPATDSFLAEVRAQGVEMFAAHLRTNSNEQSPAKLLALGAEEFAAQLRGNSNGGAL